MRLNLIADPGGRHFARAMSQAYQSGYDDAKALNKNGRKIYPRKTGMQITKEIASKALGEHTKFLRSAYGAGMWQYKREVGQ